MAQGFIVSGTLRPRRHLFTRHISKIECIEIALFTGEGAPGTARQSAITRWATHVRDTSSTMALNPNFFPNGYQDSLHPEDEVVTNWVRALAHPYNPYRSNTIVAT